LITCLCCLVFETKKRQIIRIAPFGNAQQWCDYVFRKAYTSKIIQNFSRTLWVPAKNSKKSLEENIITKIQVFLFFFVFSKLPFAVFDQKIQNTFSKISYFKSK
jgi:TolB-like protein